MSVIVSPLVKPGERLPKSAFYPYLVATTTRPPASTPSSAGTCRTGWPTWRSTSCPGRDHDRARARRRQAGGGDDHQRALVVAGAPPLPVLHEGRRRAPTSPTSSWKAGRASTRTRRGGSSSTTIPSTRPLAHPRGLRRALPRALDARRHARPSSPWSSWRPPEAAVPADDHLRRLQSARPGKGRGARLVRPVLDALRGPGRGARPHQRRRATSRAWPRRPSRRGFRRIVAVGGDGTWSNVADALIRSGSGAALGLVPAGTGCDLAKSLGVPAKDVAGCARIVRDGAHHAHRRRARSRAATS